MYIYIYTHVYIYTYAQVYIYKYVCIYIYFVPLIFEGALADSFWGVMNVWEKQA